MSAAPTGNWGDLELMKNYGVVEKGSWKCQICLVTNPPGTQKCVACESDNPDDPPPVEEAPKDPFAASKRKAGASIDEPKSKKAATGFSGGLFNNSDSTKPAGVSFGGVAPTTAGNGSTGFSFGGGAVSFGGAKPAATEPAAGFSVPAGGFSFGGVPAAAVAATEEKPEEEEEEEDDGFEDAGPVPLITSKSPSGVVASVGTGDCGQLGFGEDEDVEVDAPRVVPALAKQKVVAVASGGLHNAVVTAKGEVWTWGSQDDCALGRGGDEWVPAKVAGLTNVTQIAASDTHTVALTADGQVYSWGTYKDGNGYLGFKQGVLKQVEPVRLDFGLKMKKKKMVMIACGSQHTVALSEDGKVYCWGTGEQGQLARKVLPGRKKLTLEARPITLPGRGAQRKAVAVFCGGYSTFAVTESGRVYGWGLNNFGQLGLGDGLKEFVYTHPTLLRSLDPSQLGGGHVVQMAGGEHHMLALTNKGRVYAFGRRDSGQLGVGGAAEKTKECERSPRLIRGLRRVVRISAGGAHSCAVTAEGGAYTWGYGESAQLGNEADQDERSPFKVGSGALKKGEDGVHNVLQVEGGGQHSLFLFKKN